MPDGPGFHAFPSNSRESYDDLAMSSSPAGARRALRHAGFKIDAHGFLSLATAILRHQDDEIVRVRFGEIGKPFTVIS